MDDALYMEPRQWRLTADPRTFMNLVYPWAMFGQSYYLHTQDRRVLFENAPYDFFNDVPKGHEKVNAYRRWIQEELLGESRPMGHNSIPTKLVPVANLTRSA